MAGGGPRPLPGAGPLRDPLGIDAEFGGKLLVEHEPLGERHRDARSHREQPRLPPVEPHRVTLAEHAVRCH